MTPSWIPAAVVVALSIGAFVSSADTVNRTDTLRGQPSTEESVPVTAWQSYCGVEPGRVHRWSAPGKRITVERLPPVSEGFRTGYAYVQDGALILRDMASGELYQLDGGEFLPVVEGWPCPPFSAGQNLFAQQTDLVEACMPTSGRCQPIAIKEGSWPYAFAEYEGKTLAATNYGAALIFDGSTWCRTTVSGEAFRCDPSATMLETPRGQQFYSSITYGGVTLLGEWPTGRIYEFDGEELRPATSLPQPPFVTGERLGYEAQSMAVYCGDLYVGYWPHGEVWRWSTEASQWSLVRRLFSHPAPDAETFIPYAGREPEDLPSSFFGQRVTALVPYGDSLYASTSNLREWPTGYRPDFLSEDQISEYGAVYRIHRSGCETTAAAPQ